MQALNRVIDSVRPKRDDDVVDRANYIWTPLIASFLSLTIAAKQYVGEPLQCWIPAQFKKYWEEYAENYCFVENTYFVGMNETFPRTTEERQSRELHYYQWVSFILMGQVLFFILPKIVWSAFNWKTGLNIRSLTQAALLTKKEKGAKTLKSEAELGSASSYIANVIRYNAEYRPTRTLGIRNFWQNYVTNVYILFKVLNLLNSTGQLFLLNKFLGPQYTFWGWGILVDLVNGRNWQESGHFPRVSFCDIEIHQMDPIMGSQRVKYTLQCVLMINMFNEKVFIFLWFWLLMLSVLNSLDIVYWLLVTVFSCFGRDFIRTQLRYKGVCATDEDIRAFIDDHLFKDGVTVLRLISGNCGDLAASEIVYTLWKSQQRFSKPSLSSDSSRKGFENEQLASNNNCTCACRAHAKTC